MFPRRNPINNSRSIPPSRQIPPPTQSKERTRRLCAPSAVGPWCGFLLNTTTHTCGTAYLAQLLFDRLRVLFTFCVGWGPIMAEAQLGWVQAPSNAASTRWFEFFRFTRSGSGKIVEPNTSGWWHFDSDAWERTRGRVLLIILALCDCKGYAEWNSFVKILMTTTMKSYSFNRLSAHNDHIRLITFELSSEFP